MGGLTAERLRLWVLCLTSLAYVSTLEVFRQVAATGAKHSLPSRHLHRIFDQETGYSLSDDELNRAFLRFKDLADKKKEITSLDLASIVNDEIRDLNIRRFELVGMQVQQRLRFNEHGLLLSVRVVFTGGYSRRR